MFNTSHALRSFASPISTFLRISPPPSFPPPSSPLPLHSLLSLSRPKLNVLSSSSASSAASHARRHAQRILKNAAVLHRRHLLALAALAAALAESRSRSRSLSTRLVARCDEALKASAQNNHVYLRGKGLLGSLRRLFLSAKRIFTLTCLFLPSMVLTPVVMAVGGGGRMADLNWEYNLWGIEYAGPTFIKLCQWASTRADLFPAVFCDRLSRLQDATRGHSWRETEGTLIDSFGKNWREEIHIDENKSPIGSGCVAQVYKGNLKKATGLLPAGQEVAIKIIHPHVREKVEIDFYLMDKFAKFVEAIPGLNAEFLSIKDSVEQFRLIMYPQLDLRCEAHALNKFIKNFSDDDCVRFPQPVMSHTTPNILCEQFIKGQPIIEYMREKHTQAEKTELAVLGVVTSLKMIFEHDYVHGDLHPGNILVDKNSKGQYRMNLLDCGIVVEMGEDDHKNLVQILGALIKKDGILAGQLMVDSAKHTEATQKDVDMFCAGIQKICFEDEDENFLEKVGEYIADICYLACHHKVKLESKFINASLAVEIMEGIASALDNTLRVQEIALPIVLRAEVMYNFRKVEKSGWIDSIKKWMGA